MRGLQGAKKKERHKSKSGADQNKYNCNVAKSAEKGVVFSLLSTRSCIKYMYILCTTRSEPWALALRAFCCIQIRTKTFTSPVQRGKKLVLPSPVQCLPRVFLCFSETVKWDNWYCRWLILICLSSHRKWGGESQFHVWQWLVLQGYFPQLLSSHASRECSQGDSLCSCSMVWVGWRLGRGGFMCFISPQNTS